MRGSYGIDAPYVPFGWLLGGIACLVGAGFGFAWGGVQAGLLPLVIGVLLLLGAALYLYATRRGKFVLWRGILDRLGLRGNEQVLDLGCGRGAVLVLAAGALSTGHAVGIDLWRSMDQSGNAEDVTRRNAELEGVADRVELHTGDITKLPFKDKSFDVVLSNLAIHNIKHTEGRDAALAEAVRVLRPGGRLAIADIQQTAQYQRKLTELGLAPQRRPLGWRGWCTGPWMATTLVTATKE
jgi:arsenite methyltransferase